MHPEWIQNYLIKTQFLSKSGNSMSVSFRRLEVGDFDKGFLGVLSQLTKVGNVTKELFTKRFNLQSQNPLHHTFVGEKDGKIVCTAALLIEPKFIHECKNTGHIEDVAVDKQMRGTGLGKKLITHLLDDAKKHDCYKVILDCADHNIGFYKSCGLDKHGNEMAVYLE